ncbi:hypothetical protein Trydic_g9228 [Trypoxylus dichotomus]
MDIQQRCINNKHDGLYCLEKPTLAVVQANSYCLPACGCVCPPPPPPPLCYYAPPPAPKCDPAPAPCASPCCSDPQVDEKYHFTVTKTHECDACAPAPNPCAPAPSPCAPAPQPSAPSCGPAAYYVYASAPYPCASCGCPPAPSCCC